MADVFKNKLKFIVIVTTVLIFSACNSGSLNKIFTSPKKRTLNLYTSYIKSISTTDFPLSSFKSNSNLCDKPVYAQKLQDNNNLQFFPATLWQVYALNGKTKWKNIAEDYSSALYKENFSNKIKDGEIIQDVYLTPFLVTGEKHYNSSVLKIVAAYVSDAEKSGELDCVDNTDDCIEKLIENKLLFFASKQTGDPVYRDLALHNSELVFKGHFQNNKENELFYSLANWNTTPDYNELNKLSSDDFYDLALCFYGLTILDNEMGIEKHHELSLKLANVFKTLFENFENDPESNNSAMKKIDNTMLAMVCLAFNNVNSNTQNNYAEISEAIFDQILDSLEKTGVQKKQQSFRMYYYLFEYLKQKEMNT